MHKRLILVRGLGGTGKTTLSRAISSALKIPVLNRDDVKWAVRGFELGSTLETEIGYAVMNELARVQLLNGISVVLDANARFRSMQDFYEQMAREAKASFHVITCVCANETEWAKRIADRGLSHPLSFKDTQTMAIEPLDLETQLHLDTSKASPEAALRQALIWLDS